MKRLIHLALLLIALTGLTAQSTAYATTFDHMAMPMEMSAGSTSCGDLVQQGPRKVPCKKVGLDCLAAIGCPAAMMGGPGFASNAPGAIVRMKSLPALAEALRGRSYAPELEPPSTLN